MNIHKPTAFPPAPPHWGSESALQEIHQFLIAVQRVHRDWRFFDSEISLREAYKRFAADETSPSLRNEVIWLAETFLRTAEQLSTRLDEFYRLANTRTATQVLDE